MSKLFASLCIIIDFALRHRVLPPFRPHCVMIKFHIIIAILDTTLISKTACVHKNIIFVNQNNQDLLNKKEKFCFTGI